MTFLYKPSLSVYGLEDKRRHNVSLKRGLHITLRVLCLRQTESVTGIMGGKVCECPIENLIKEYI